ncbi:hypothetical protein [Sphingomonas sp. LM7]|uniref:hypothetical protein n=1 Tax=Sphingomonas sp. LM7 TaxID=1938607 RepID=UPI000983C3EF|nr:hypothetical protein [Sphingomonas sp. LM7]AQR72336.1 hypothetical protein BXU08_00450 [Sphingomonas sp. LM7]
MRGAYWMMGVALCFPAAAQAAGCEESFTKAGSFISGMKFRASVTVADLTPASAIGQMRGVAAGKGYDILVAEAEDGSMLIEQPQTGKARAFPITITATTSGKTGLVEMEAKLRAGQTVSSDAAKTEMCAMLGQIKGGKAGLAAASAGMKAVSDSAPLAISALSLSQQVSKDTERNAAAIPLRYQGKTFIIDGMVEFATKDGGDFIVTYKIPHPHQQVLRLPGQAAFKTDIACVMAKGQAAFTLQLKPGKSIKLSGVFDRFSATDHLLLLKDCRSVR